MLAARPFQPWNGNQAHTAQEDNTSNVARERKGRNIRNVEY